jgi:hypothetical protein
LSGSKKLSSIGGWGQFDELGLAVNCEQKPNLGHLQNYLCGPDGGVV